MQAVNLCVTLRSTSIFGIMVPWTFHLLIKDMYKLSIEWRF